MRKIIPFIFAAVLSQSVIAEAASPTYKITIAGCDKFADSSPFTATEFRLFVDGVRAATSAVRTFDVDVTTYKGKKVIVTAACYGADASASDMSNAVAVDLRKIPAPTITITISDVATKTEIILQ